MILIDTSIAIQVRDGDEEALSRFADLPMPPALSLISVVELHGGVLVDPERAARRRARLDALLNSLTILDFEKTMVDVYADIVRQVGFSRRRILDRLIAATAIVHDLTLVTVNGADFRDIPNLKLEVWSTSAQ